MALLAQKGKKEEPSFYVFNEKGEPSKLEDARYLGILEKISDTAYQWKFYNFSGHLITIETFVDKSLTIPHGYFAFFDKNGKIDSSGYIYNHQRDKKWLYFNDSLKIIQTEVYDRGNLLERIGREELNKKATETSEDSSLSYKVEKEANYKNGEAGWRKYLEKNLKIPDRTISLGKNGTTVSYFIVDTDGRLHGFFLAQSVEYSFDEAVISLLKNSPAWEPAIKNGKPVKAYRMQPITVSTN